MHRWTHQLVAEMQLRRYSPQTIKAYKYAVEKLLSGRARPFDPPSVAEARAHLMELSQRDVSGSLLNQHSAGLRCFFRLVLGEEVSLERIGYAKRKRRLPVVLSRDEVSRLLRATQGIQYRAIFMTAYASGLRLVEVRRLEVTDIDSSRMRIRVRDGKGGKDRYSLLGPALLAELRGYYREVRPKDLLFPSLKRGCSAPIGARAVQRAFQRYRKRAGIAKPASFHTLRHSFATHLLESGVDTTFIQQLLGHRSIKTTLRYVQVAVDAKSMEVRTPLDHLGLL